MDSLVLVKNWAMTLIVPTVVLWVCFMIGYDIYASALGPVGRTGLTQTNACKSLPDGTQICDMPIPKR